MTKVEELREKFCESLTYEFSGMLRGVLADFPALIAAAKEEGAEVERERIRQEAVEHGCWSWQQEGEKMIQTVEIRADVIVPKEANSEQT